MFFLGEELSSSTAKETSLREEIAKLRQEERNISFLPLFLTYFCLVCLFFASWRLEAIHFVWMIPIMGVLQYYIVISGHEAVHKTLCYPKVWNEFFGVLGQALVGVNFTAYRLQHIDHHQAKTHLQDPDSHIYMRVMRVRKGWRRFVYLTFGTLIEIVIKIRQKGSGGYGTDRKIKPKIRKNMKRDSLLVILAQLAIMGLSYVCLGGLPFSTGFSWLDVGFGLVWCYAWMWIVPLFGITVFLNRCRIVIEHGLALQIHGEQDESIRIPTIDILSHPVERFFFAPFLFNYHCAHHLFMSVPHYNLPKLHALLEERQHKGYHHIRGGYVKALVRAMNTPKIESI